MIFYFNHLKKQILKKTILIVAIFNWLVTCLQNALAIIAKPITGQLAKDKMHTCYNRNERCIPDTQ